MKRRCGVGAFGLAALILAGCGGGGASTHSSSHAFVPHQIQPPAGPSGGVKVWAPNGDSTAGCVIAADLDFSDGTSLHFDAAGLTAGPISGYPGSAPTVGSLQDISLPFVSKDLAISGNPNSIQVAALSCSDVEDQATLSGRPYRPNYPAVACEMEGAVNADGISPAKINNDFGVAGNQPEQLGGAVVCSNAENPNGGSGTRPTPTTSATPSSGTGPTPSTICGSAGTCVPVCQSQQQVDCNPAFLAPRRATR